MTNRLADGEPARGATAAAAIRASWAAFRDALPPLLKPAGEEPSDDAQTARWGWEPATSAFRRLVGETHTLIVFPEGTRTMTDTLLPFERGGAPKPIYVLLTPIRSQLYYLMEAYAPTEQGGRMVVSIRDSAGRPVVERGILAEADGAALRTLGARMAQGGRLGDLYGARRLFLLGTALFTAASAVCDSSVPSSSAP